MTTTASKRHRISNTCRVLHRVHVKDARTRACIEAQKLNTTIAEQALAAREDAGLTQSQPAKLVGTTQSVISRLEDADHDGHCLSMLQRIATALNRRVVIRLVARPATSKRTATRA
jgi:ribosome-binding protein aMBF1 (putative translation factor)